MEQGFGVQIKGFGYTHSGKTPPCNEAHFFFTAIKLYILSSLTDKWSLTDVPTGNDQ